MSTVPRPPVHRIVFLQLALAIAASLIAWIHSDVAAKSALLGGLTNALPNAYFIWRAFRYSGARSAHLIVHSFYQGESWKFLLTALCFVVIFQRVEPLNVLALFSGFVTVQLGHVAAAKVANL
ncbi:MAG: ATP synthase subunit I [Oceanobacter sp.]